MDSNAAEATSAARDLGCVTVEPIKEPSGMIDWTATRTKLEEAYAGFPPDPDSGAPAWNAAYNQLWAQENERAIVKRMQELDARITVPDLDVGFWPPQHGGIVFDEQRAMSHPCTRINLGNGDYLVYAKGVIGALDADKEQRLCVQGFVDEEPSPAEVKRLRTMAVVSHQCAVQTKDIPKDEHLPAYFACVGEGLRANGEDG